jgi:hypothetical protein
MTEMDATEARRRSYHEEPALSAGKRLGVQWCPWMGDWFTSWSPRNDNNNAEGEWDQWVDLALKILSDPLTQITRPEAFIERDKAGIRDYYTGANRRLTETELEERFPLVRESPE